MLVRNSNGKDIFECYKNISLNDKSYSLRFGNSFEGKRTIIINGDYTTTDVSESDIENMTPKFKERVKLAVNQYEIALRIQRDYLNWDGKLD